MFSLEPFGGSYTSLAAAGTTVIPQLASRLNANFQEEGDEEK